MGSLNAELFHSKAMFFLKIHSLFLLVCVYTCICTCLMHVEECLSQLILYIINIIITVVVIVRQELTNLVRLSGSQLQLPLVSASSVLAEVCYCAWFFCGCWRWEIRFPCMHSKYLPTRLSSPPVVGFLDFFRSVLLKVLVVLLLMLEMI